MSSKTVLSIDIGGSNLRFGFFIGDTLKKRQQYIWPNQSDSVTDLNFIREKALSMVEDTECLLPSVVGVSLAASVNLEGTVVGWPNRPSWQGVPIVDKLKDIFCCPIYVADDATTSLIAEKTTGAARDLNSAFLLSVGTGLGSGIMIDRHVIRGENGWAGEIGHTVIQEGGLICPCGRRGCAQQYASGAYLKREAMARGYKSMDEMGAASDFGNQIAAELYSVFGERLGSIAGDAVNLLDVQGVIVGGGITSWPDLWKPSFVDSLLKSTINSSHRSLVIRLAHHKQDSALIGAKVLAESMIAAN